MKRREFLKASTMGVAATTGLLVIGNQVNGIEQPAASGRLESPDPEVLAKAVYRNFIPGKMPGKHRARFLQQHPCPLI